MISRKPLNQRSCNGGGGLLRPSSAVPGWEQKLAWLRHYFGLVWSDTKPRKSGALGLTRVRAYLSSLRRPSAQSRSKESQTWNLPMREVALCRRTLTRRHLHAKHVEAASCAAQEIYHHVRGVPAMVSHTIDYLYAV